MYPYDALIQRQVDTQEKTNALLEKSLKEMKKTAYDTLTGILFAIAIFSVSGSIMLVRRIKAGLSEIY
jgi:hypothetical protein